MDYFVNDNIVFPKKGDLLISEPYLPDPNFERTVIYLCEHDANGSFGFVINKESNNTLSDLIGVETKKQVFIGGPVEQDTLHFLHKKSVELSKNQEVGSGICWGADFEGAVSGLENFLIDPLDVKFFIGYSGWGKGQLNKEIKEKSWIVYKNPTAEMIFEMDAAKLWQNVLQNMGGKFRVISNYPLDPRLN
jgi:putative transcriptional regulator